MRSNIIRANIAVGLAVLFLSTTVEAQDELDPLAELADLGSAMSDSGPEGGGSIRAKKDVDMAAAKRKKDKRNVQAKVTSVQQGKAFPVVAIKVKVMRPASSGDGSKLARNSEVVLIPRLKAAGKSIDMSHDHTRINAGAFYLQSGDTVYFRPGSKKSDSLWEADYIERK